MRMLVLLFCLMSGAAFASGGGGGGGGGAADLLRLDPLVVNLRDGHLIQFTPQLKLTDAKDLDTVKAYTPVVRFQLIKSLIGLPANEVQTAKFMGAFAESAVEVINKALKEEYVKEVLFDGWLIQ